jgi:hypothetical protein
MSAWAGLPLTLWLAPSLGGLIEPATTLGEYANDVGMAWLALGVAGLVIRVLQLWMQDGLMTGLVWATKIITDPFHDIALYYKAPWYLLRGQLIDLALEQPELSPRELAVTFTDERAYFVSEASVYRLLRAHGLITSPAFAVMKAADEFHDKTTAPNQLWQTDFTYLKVTGWGWFYLSTILDDFSRYIIAWKLCTTMRANDVTDTIQMALEASGLDERPKAHRPRLLSDNGSSVARRSG